MRKHSMPLSYNGANGPRIDQVENHKKLVYIPKPDKSESMRYTKAILFPTAVFVLALITVHTFAGMGRNIIAPLTGIVWIWGVICAQLQDKERIRILNETHVTLAGYLGTMTALRYVIGLVSGVSAESIMASLDQLVPTTGGNAIIYFLQTALMITLFMTPVTFIGAQAKRLFGSKKNGNAKQVFRRHRGYIPDTKNQ